MKISNLKLKHNVADRWYPEWGVGVVTKLLKTRAVISYPDRTLTYDSSHTQFLSPK